MTIENGKSVTNRKIAFLSEYHTIKISNLENNETISIINHDKNVLDEFKYQIIKLELNSLATFLFFIDSYLTLYLYNIKALV